jgi:hypothetical protein
LKKAGAHRVQRIEGIAGAEQQVAAVHDAACGHHRVQAVEFALRKTYRQAQLAQVAVGARDLEFRGLDGHHGSGSGHDGIAGCRMMQWSTLFGRGSARALSKIKNADGLLMHHAPP